MGAFVINISSSVAYSCLPCHVMPTKEICPHEGYFIYHPFFLDRVGNSGTYSSLSLSLSRCLIRSLSHSPSTIHKCGGYYSLLMPSSWPICFQRPATTTLLWWWTSVGSQRGRRRCTAAMRAEALMTSGELTDWAVETDWASTHASCTWVPAPGEVFLLIGSLHGSHRTQAPSLQNTPRLPPAFYL